MSKCDDCGYMEVGVCFLCGDRAPDGGFVCFACEAECARERELELSPALGCGGGMEEVYRDREEVVV